MATISLILCALAVAKSKLLSMLLIFGKGRKIVYSREKRNFAESNFS
jgi:hypothetical protein